MMAATYPWTVFFTAGGQLKIDSDAIDPPDLNIQLPSIR
jgi:hypothetical protein